MSYDKSKYTAMRSLEIPRNLALAMSDDEFPISGGSGSTNHFYTMEEYQAEAAKSFPDLKVGDVVFIHENAVVSMTIVILPEPEPEPEDPGGGGSIGF